MVKTAPKKTMTQTAIHFLRIAKQPSTLGKMLSPVSLISPLQQNAYNPVDNVHEAWYMHFFRHKPNRFSNIGAAVGTNCEQQLPSAVGQASFDGHSPVCQCILDELPYIPICMATNCLGGWSRYWLIRALQLICKAHQNNIT